MALKRPGGLSSTANRSNPQRLIESPAPNPQQGQPRRRLSIGVSFPISSLPYPTVQRILRYPSPLSPPPAQGSVEHGSIINSFFEVIDSGAVGLLRQPSPKHPPTIDSDWRLSYNLLNEKSSSFSPAPSQPSLPFDQSGYEYGSLFPDEQDSSSGYIDYPQSFGENIPPLAPPISPLSPPTLPFRLQHIAALPASHYPSNTFGLDCVNKVNLRPYL